ncbi:MAG: NAD-dependent protein deacylase [Kofleriaceae bacterium]
MPETPRPRRPTKTTLRSDVVEAAATLLARAESVLFITGAGLSADSGGPAYRGIGGLYRDKASEKGATVEVGLSADTLQRRPKLTWTFLAQIEAAGRDTRPNEGHEVLTWFERALPRSLILTQNVDGLHRAAGAERVCEIHGNLRDLRCTRCDFRSTVRDFTGLYIPPACPQCKGLLRPDIVLFGESLPHAPFTQLQAELEQGFDLVVAVGCTAMFPYIARPVLVAKSEGTPTIEITPQTTDLSEIVDLRLRSTPAAAMRRVWAAYKAMAPSATLSDVRR